MTAPLAYRRILLKISGEALMGSEDYGIDPAVIGRIAREIIEARDAGAEVGLVIGGGNIFRGAGLAASGMDRVTGDQMGMLATVINALAMQDALEKLGARVRVMSALKINDVCEDYIRRRAVRHLEKGRIAIFAAGTRYDQLPSDGVLTRDLQVMDTAAFALCRDSDVPLRIYDLSVPGNLMRILRGENIGTLVKGRG